MEILAEMLAVSVHSWRRPRKDALEVVNRLCALRGETGRDIEIGILTGRTPKIHSLTNRFLDGLACRPDISNRPWLLRKAGIIIPGNVIPVNTLTEGAGYLQDRIHQGLI